MWHVLVTQLAMRADDVVCEMQMQPPVPALQQLTPLRPPPKTPRAVACAVHDNILGAVDLAEAPMPDGVKHNCLLFKDASEVSHSPNPGISA